MDLVTSFIEIPSHWLENLYYFPKVVPVGKSSELTTEDCEFASHSWQEVFLETGL